LPFKDKNKKKEYYQNIYNQRKQFLDDYKMRLGCQMCGYNKHPKALCFDHIDPYSKDKKYSAKQLQRWNETKLLEELNKCRVLCANCHNIETYENGHHKINKKTSSAGLEMGSIHIKK